MTREDAIEYWEQFNAEIDDLYDACSDADRDVLVKQREIVEYTISALRQQEHFREVTKKVEPLTLDELRQMDGEPVWVVCLEPERYYEPPIGWRIIEKSIVGTFGVWNDSSCLAERDYGETWLAYRQKPEDGTV